LKKRTKKLLLIWAWVQINKVFLLLFLQKKKAFLSSDSLEHRR